MIDVSLCQRGERLCLTVMGHAGYAPHGRDIVCAGVSSLCMALVCHLEYLEAQGELISLDYRGGSGFFTCRMLCRPFASLPRSAIDLVCRGFILIEERYPDCLQFSSRHLP